MDSLNPKAASFLHRTFLWGGRVQVIQVSAFIIVIHVPPQRDQAWAPLIHASAPFPQENGLSTSIHATSSPSEEDLCNSILYYIYAHSSPSRPDPSASILAPFRLQAAEEVFKRRHPRAKSTCSFGTRISPCGRSKDSKPWTPRTACNGFPARVWSRGTC